MRIMSLDTTVVVTGAASGIGRAIAERFVQEGRFVVAADVAGVQLNAPPDRWRAVRCDIGREGDIAETVAVAESMGRPSALVNCAGVSTKAPIDQISAAEWQRVIDINLTGSALCIKHVLPAMKRAGGGSIVNIASIAAFSTASRHNTIYAASKGAIVSFTRALVYELSPHGIRVNAVAPGIVDTPILRGHGPEWFADRASRVPLGRLGSVEEISSVVWFLASDAASYVTGQTVVVDGGITSVMYSPDQVN